MALRDETLNESVDRPDLGPPSEVRLDHPALSTASEAASTPGEADLKDGARLAVLLEAAAVLAHLGHCGLRPLSAAEGFRIETDGRLLIGKVVPGKLRNPPQATLRQLLLLLFRGQNTVAGRGEARRVARELLALWNQQLVPISADRAVAEILLAAPFLWQPTFAPWRRSLVAGLPAGNRTWVAGPGAARRSLLAETQDRLALEELLASTRAQACWEGWRDDDEPEELLASGKLRRAAALWRAKPPKDAAARLQCARLSYELGRYGEAVATLRGQEDLAAGCLRCRCLVFLGNWRAAEGALRDLDPTPLKPAALLELAEAAVRICANRRQLPQAEDWAARALAASRGALRHRARLLASEVACDQGRLERASAWIEEARDALQRPELEGRWHHARTLLAFHAQDGPAMAEHAALALRADRRRRSLGEVGRLWSELAVGRVLSDDLPGAERACRHALRLLSTCEGPSTTTLAQFNLAEVRLRRGRTEGVEATLEASLAENQREDNKRAVLHDLELWVRLELAQGRMEAALARAEEAQNLLAREPARRPVFAALSGRALGWLGRRTEAEEQLLAAGEEGLAELESEERPSAWALAGRFDRAQEAAESTPWAQLWRSLAIGVPPSSACWSQLESLEPFRAARLVYDCEMVRAGSVPPSWVRRASSALSQAGNKHLAERLENRTFSPWLALQNYLEQERPEITVFGQLLLDMGYRDSRVVWQQGEQSTVLLPGPGGSEILQAPAAGGWLRLEAKLVDPTLRALFALLARDLRLPGPETAGPEAQEEGSDLIGRSPQLYEVLTRLDRLAPSELPVLILGESGTGKELVARRVHRFSLRSQGPFLPINCAAISETVALSELFGHVRGAFTGAERNHVGVFEEARGGTVFLDEIGDLPASAQGMLLRVLQEKEIRRLGESYTRKVDVRIIAATHRPLASMVEQQSFRQDLFFRLRVAAVELPPLRQRGEDIQLLVEHFLRKHGGTRPPGISEAARARLAGHRWPGNVRELENVLTVACMLAAGGEIEPEHLDLPVEAETAEAEAGTYHEQVERYRRSLLEAALAAAGGQQAEAARQLGVSRQTMSYLKRRYDLH